MYIVLSLLISQSWGQDSLNMRVLYQWNDTTIPPAPWIGNPFNEIWGWYDSTNQREYAIIGSVDGTHIFDITDVADGVVDTCDYILGKASNVIHRDYKTQGHYLYAVSDEGPGNLQIIDLSYLPDSAPLVNSVDTFFAQSHNIWIDGDIMYAAIPRGIPGKEKYLGLYDLSDPVNPVFLAGYDDFWIIHDIYARNDTAYLNASNRGLRVVDFSDPLDPQLLADYRQYPYAGYNHSGWLSEDGDYYYMADETHGTPLKTLDVRNLDDLELVSFVHPDIEADSIFPEKIPHNPVVAGQYLFCSYYYDGVYAFDMSQPDDPVVAGFYDTFDPPHDGFYKGNWGVYPLLPSGHILASDMQSGLYVLEFTPDTVAVTPPDTGTTRIEPSWVSGVRIGPNPTSDRVVISGLPVGHWDYVLMDNMGRMAEKGQFEVKGMEFKSIFPKVSNGMYKLVLKSRKGRLARNIIISR